MTTEPLYNHVELQVAGLEVTLFYMGVTNHALAHNHIPVVRLVRLALPGNAAGPSPAGQLTVTGSVDGTQLFTSGAIPFPALNPGDAVHLEPHDVTRVPSARTLETTEARTGEMTVEVVLGDRSVIASTDLEVLAPDEWFNSPLYYESLAAWVQPNSPSVTPLLSTVSDTLLAHTGDGAVSGYQGGTDRAVAIAAAVFEALRSLDIRYINPPASFENTGQRVRTSGRVLTDRLGTCIDLSLAYAAVAEQCGLLPVVLILPGHAMAGVLLSGDHLPTPVITDPAVINNYLRSGRLLPVDAVFYDSSTSFRRVVARSREQLEDTPVHGLIDVKGSHRDGMRPFPDGTAGSPVAAPTVQDDTASPGVTPTNTWSLPDTGTTSGENAVFRDVDDPAPIRVQTWKRELLDLSLRNRLLNMRPGPEVLPFLLAPGGLAELDDQIHAGQRIAVHPVDDVSVNRQLQGIRDVTGLPADQVAADLTDRHRIYADLTDARYLRWFRNLNRQVRTYTEETGSSNLYLTLGAMIHSNSAGKPALAPLFLIPVKIVGGRGNSRFQIQVDTTTEATPNHCLVEWLRQVHNVTIDALARPRLDASGLDIGHAVSAISAALIEADLPYTVVEYSHLIIAKFSTYGMWKDLRDNWARFLEAPVFHHLTTKAGTDFVDPVEQAAGVPVKRVEVTEEELALPVPADGAQLQAVTAAAAGYSFVLEGPPGTGKSQTITNLIAHCMDMGKTVLFVAEKQAALDVVRDRLARVGLGPFTLDLHGAEQKPTAIRQQLKKSVDAEVHYDMHLWDAAVANLRSRMTPLMEYPGQIHDSNGAGYSLWSAVSTLTSMDDGPVAPVPERVVASPPVPVEQLQSLTSALAVQAGITDFSTTTRWSLVGASLRSDSEVTEAWRSLADATNLLRRFPDLVPLLADPDQGDLVRRLREVEAIDDDQRLTPEECRRWTDSSDRLTAVAQQVGRLAPDFAGVGALFSPTFILSGDDTSVLAALEDTKKGLFGRKKRLAAYQTALMAAVPVTVSTSWTDSATHTATHTATGIDVESAYAPEKVEPQLRRLPHLRKVAADLDRTLAGIPGAERFCGRSPADPSLAADLRIHGLFMAQAVEESSRHPELMDLSRRAPAVGVTEPLSQVVARIGDAWSHWCDVLGATPDTVTAWVAATGAANQTQAWLSCADAWAADLSATGTLYPTRTAQWETTARPLRHAGLTDLVDRVEQGLLDPRDLDMALHRGLAEASVSERSQRFNLSSFHRALREEELTQLTRAISRVQDEATRALPARLLARRPFVPGRLDGRAALLRRQLDAKRNARSFRSLLGEFGEEILSVAPCFFVSPASLATFVDPGAVTFDVVIFDEASQVTVDQAMGALGRARSAVIVGDSKQMPPTRIGKTTTGGGEDLPEDLGQGSDMTGDGDAMSDIDDLESILSEAVESGLPQLWLSWHYRSRDESLIAFSNERYYEGNLSSLPSPGGEPGAGVSVVRVDGQFLRKADVKAGSGALGTNPVEARAIVDSVIRRVNSPLTCKDSLGVVTFNVPQRDLVLDLLEECGDPLVTRRLVPGPEGIFVKNLENVQGDERDVILFSTAFSRHSDGRPMPMNFGPLSRKGGERRLNVAITRARKEVELFCSFAPSEIDPHRTSSQGLQDLRGYLEAAVERTAPTVRSERGRATVNVNTLRDALASALRARGWVVETDYGLSSYTLDLVVRPPDDERWHAAVLTDGDKWADMPTVADRDLTPGLLGSLMNWAATIRVWLPEWIADRDAVIDRVDAEIRAAGATISAQDAARAAVIRDAEAALAAERERTAAEERDEEQAPPELGEGGDDDTPEAPVQWAEAGTTIADDVVTEAAVPVAGAVTPSAADNLSASPHVLPTEVAYVDPVTAPPLGERTELESGFSLERLGVLRTEVATMIRQSAPVRLDLLRSAIAKRFNRLKTSKLVNGTIDELIPAELMRDEGTSGDAKETFVWPTADGPAGWNHVRPTGGRNLPEIPLTEIAGAARLVLAAEPTLDDPAPESRELLHREVLRVFGITRLTGQARSRIDRALELL